MDHFYKERRLCQSSTGAGLVYILPSSCQDAPLPPHLQQQSRVPPTLHYSLTSHSEHNHKPTSGLLGNHIYSKASPHWNTHFLNELAQRLQDCRSVKVVLKPVSEIQDHYRGQSAPHKPLLGQHRTLLALYGQLDHGSALLPKEPLLGTAQEDYRHFHRSELAPPSGLNAPPFQRTLTKSAALSHLPPHKAPPNTGSQLQLPRPHMALPHGGRTSLYMDSFTLPACLPKLSTTHDRAECREVGGRRLLRHILEVPKMYGTESQTYGKGKMVRV